MKPATRPLPSVNGTPVLDVRELLKETLLNKQVLASLDGILRPSVAAMTRVLELTGQSVEARQQQAETMNRRTDRLFEQFDRLATRLSAFGHATLIQGRVASPAETEALASASTELDDLGKQIDVLLAEHTALWETPQLRGRNQP